MPTKPVVMTRRPLALPVCAIPSDMLFQIIKTQEAKLTLELAREQRVSAAMVEERKQRGKQHRR